MQAAASKNGEAQSRIGAVTAELEETRQNLHKAREEINSMSKCIQALKEELEETKKELKRLKGKDYLKQPAVSPEIEELKFVETATDATAKEQRERRYVKFASPPSRVAGVGKEEMFERRPSVNKKKMKKPLLPMMKWLFSIKKGGQEDESPRNY